MNIRFLQESDIPQASAIVGKNYNKPYEEMSAAEMQEMFGSATIKPKYMVVEEDDTIVACAGFMQSWMDYNIWNIFWVNVDPDRQRCGIGKQLVQRVIDEIKEDMGGVCLILLTTDSPSYYADHFGFVTLQSFLSGAYQLMSLSLED